MDHAHLAPLDRALLLVERYLGQQLRFCHETAVDHCCRVGEGVHRIAESHLQGEELEQAVLAGVLHDLVEDGVSWDAPEELEALRLEIRNEFGVTVLSVVEEVTVDQRLGPTEQFQEFRGRVSHWSLAACLVRWADILDNALTRYVYAATYLALWEDYATDMLRNLIPARLRALSWPGPLPPAHLPPCVVPDLGTPP